MAARDKSRSHNLSRYGMMRLRLSLAFIAGAIGLFIYGWTAKDVVAILFAVFLVYDSTTKIAELYRRSQGKTLH